MEAFQNKGEREIVKSGKIVVQLDPPTRVYQPGDRITGKVVTNLPPDLDISKGIDIELYGLASVSWTEGSGDDEKSYGDIQAFFRLSQHHPASHEVSVYPFTFQIPNEPGLPWSTITAHGRVEYGIKAVIKTPRFHFDKNHIAIFSLNSIITSGTIESLSGNSYLSTSNVRDSKVGNVCLPCFCWYFCCSKESLRVGVTHHSLISLPGATVPVTVLVDNTSSKHVGNGKLQLVGEWVHFAGYETTRSYTILHEQVLDLNLNPGDKVTKQETLKLPVDLMPSQVQCRVLQLHYKIRVVLSDAENAGVEISGFRVKIPASADADIVIVMPEEVVQTQPGS